MPKETLIESAPPARQGAPTDRFGAIPPRSPPPGTRRDTFSSRASWRISGEASTIDTPRQSATLALVACVPSSVLADPDASSGPRDAVETSELLHAFLSATPEGRIAVQEADDLVLSFTSADSAFASACLFQQRWGQALAEERQVRFRALLDAVPADPGSRLGPAATLEIAHQLPATRLFATHRFIHALPPSVRMKFRAVEPDATACGTSSIQLFESCCAEEDCTQLAIPTLKQPDSPREHSLRLRWRSNQLQLDAAAPPITLGRGSAADIRIRTEYVSRTHAKVTFVQANYVLYDESTNGTFVRIDDDEEKLIHHEQIVLRGSGVISLGRGIKTGTASLIYFTAT